MMSRDAAAAICVILMVVSYHSAYSQEKCETQISVEILNGTILKNGSLWDLNEKVLYPQDTFRVEGSRMYGCPCMLSSRPCLRKCCQKNQAMNFHSLDCEPYNASQPWFRPNLTVDKEGTARIFEEDQFGILYGNFCWGYLLEPNIYAEDKYVFEVDNASLTVSRKSNSSLGTNGFCVEYFPEVDTYFPYVCFTGSKAAGERDACHHIRFILYPIGMVVSILFLLASLVVYAIEPKLRNLCGKCTMFYMGSLLCSYVSLSTVQGLGGELSDSTCLAFGFIIYLSLLCTFFWLNVLCIDITLAFRSSQSIPGNPAERDRKKLIVYSLYAWGVPVLITIATIIAEFHPSVDDTGYKPKFHVVCWFHDEFTRLIYFIFPVAIVLSVNLGLFIYTARNIYLINKKNQEECSKKKGKRRCSKEDKKRLRIYVKLYVLMGVTWILEILSFLIGGSKCIWLFTDMINTLQGLFIFLILVCNRKVIGLLRKRLCRKAPSPGDPIARLDESASSSEDEVQTSSASTDGATPGGEIRMKSTEKATGAGTTPGSSPATGGGPQSTGHK